MTICDKDHISIQLALCYDESIEKDKEMKVYKQIKAPHLRGLYFKHYKWCKVTLIGLYWIELEVRHKPQRYTNAMS